MTAAVGLLNCQFDFGGLVRAGDRPEAARAPAAEQAAQQIVNIDIRRSAITEASSARPGPGLPGSGPGPGSGPAALPVPLGRVYVLRYLSELRSERVVTTPGGRVRQHRVRLGDVLEPVFRARVLVDVRMMSTRELAVSPLDVVLAGVPRHAQDLVEILAGGHYPAFATITCAGRSWLSPAP